jgi:hypothetical protein
MNLKNKYIVAIISFNNNIILFNLISRNNIQGSQAHIGSMFEKLC